MGILDIQNTPCARESLLHGAGASLVTGLLHFLATSKSMILLILSIVIMFYVFNIMLDLLFTGRVKRSFDVGVAGFMLTTLGSWCVSQKLALKL